MGILKTVIRKMATLSSHILRTATGKIVMDRAVILRDNVPDRVLPAAMDSRTVRRREIIHALAVPLQILSIVSRHRDRDRLSKIGLPPGSDRRSGDSPHRPVITSLRDRVSLGGLFLRDRAHRRDSPGKVLRNLYPGREAHLAAGRKNHCWGVS